LQSLGRILILPPVNRPGVLFLAWSFVALFALGSRAEVRVLATLPALHSWAANVAGDDAVVECLLPSDVGPHDFQFKPSDLRKLAAANVVLMNGLGVDQWLNRAISRAAAQPSRRVVTVTQGLGRELIRDLTRLSVDGKPGKDRHDHDHGDHDHDHGDEANPHVWLDPVLARHAISNIVAALAIADPLHKEAYAARGWAYLGRIDALHAEMTTALLPHAGKPIVTFHDAFPYLCRRYQLDLVGVVEEVPSVDPSPKYLARLSAAIRSRKVGVVFSEPQFNPRLVRQLGKDLGIRVAELDVLETGKPGPSLYEDVMRRNLASLKSALP